MNGWHNLQKGYYQQVQWQNQPVHGILDTFYLCKWSSSFTSADWIHNLKHCYVIFGIAEVVQSLMQALDLAFFWDERNSHFCASSCLRHTSQLLNKSGHPCQWRNGSQWPLAERTGRGSLLIHPSHLPDDPISQGTELHFWIRKDRFRFQLQYKHIGFFVCSILPSSALGGSRSVQSQTWRALPPVDQCHLGPPHPLSPAQS